MCPSGVVSCDVKSGDVIYGDDQGYDPWGALGLVNGYNKQTNLPQFNQTKITQSVGILSP